MAERDKRLLSDKEIEILWEEYETNDPTQEMLWSVIVAKAQLAKADRFKEARIEQGGKG